MALKRPRGSPMGNTVSISSDTPLSSRLSSRPSGSLPSSRPGTDLDQPLARLLERAPLILLLLSIAVALPHLLLGPNFVLDDWYNVNEGISGGLFSATTDELAASRPGLPIAYGITFGLFGNHPLPLVIISSVILMVSAQLLYRTAAFFVPHKVAFALTALWIVLPNHMALEIWPSTVMISMSLLLTLFALYLMARSPESPSPTGSPLSSRTVADVGPIIVMAFAASAFYEGSLPLLCLAMLVVPKLRRGSFDLRLLFAGAISQGALAGWILLNLHSSKAARPFIGPRDVVTAFYGIGIVPVWFEPIAIVGFALAFTLLGYTAVRDRRFGLPEKLIVAGFVIIAVGLLPYLRYFFTAVGAGDRLQYLTSIGGAATIVGLFWAIARNRQFVKPLIVTGAIGLALVISVRIDGVRAWNDAGDDGIRILNAVEQADVDPLQPIVLGPEPRFYRGVTPFLDPSNVRPAVAVLFGEPAATGFITFSEEDFLEEPAGQRVDIRPAISGE